MTAAKFEIVVACDRDRGIGAQNKLPWRLSADMKYFRELTQGDKIEGEENFVIMGRKTWLSIPPKHRPLPHRRNIVLTRDVPSFKSHEAAAGAYVCSSLDEALALAGTRTDLSAEGTARCFVIGGAKVYEQALNHPGCDRLYLTQIDAKFDCDVFFPPYESTFSLLSESEVQEENGIPFSFKIYKRRHEKR